MKAKMVYPGVANLAFSEATAISQLATSWHPAAVASPVKNWYFCKKRYINIEKREINKPFAVSDHERGRSLLCFLWNRLFQGTSVLPQCAVG